MIRSRLWLIIILALAMAVPAGVVSAQQTPVYTSSAVMALAQREVDSNQNITSTALTDTQMTTQAAQVTGDDVSRIARGRGATGSVTATSKPETNLITVSSAATTPEAAAATANAFMDGFVAFRTDEARRDRDAAAAQLEQRRDVIEARIGSIQQQTGLADPLTPLASLQSQQNEVETQLAQLRGDQAPSGQTVIVINRAVTPLAPVSPQPVRDALLGAVLGLLLGAGVAVLIGTMRLRRSAQRGEPSSTADDDVAAPGSNGVVAGSVENGRRPDVVQATEHSDAVEQTVRHPPHRPSSTGATPSERPTPSPRQPAPPRGVPIARSTNHQ